MIDTNLSQHRAVAGGVSATVAEPPAAQVARARARVPSLIAVLSDLSGGASYRSRSHQTQGGRGILSGSWA